MNNYVKYAVLVIVVSVIVSYFSFFRTEVTLDGGIEYHGELVSSDISVEDGYISISSFKDTVEENIWISPNEVVIRANHESEGMANYKFNSVDINLEKLQFDLDSIVISDKEYDVVYRLANYDLLLASENDDYYEFYAYRKEKLSQIGSLKKLGDLPFIVSKDLSKVLYLDKDSNINTYNLLNSKKKNSVINFPSESSSDFFNQFEISSDGGFFSYMTLSENYSESSFSIYGADSARLYAKDIIGVKPSFSAFSNKVAFFYSGDVTSNILSKSRVGVLSLKSKKITYYDRTDEGENYTGHIKWTSDNEKIIFTSSIDKDNYINILDIPKMLKLNYGVDEVKLENNLRVVGDKVYWIVDDKDTKKLSILDTSGKSPIYVEKLRTFGALDSQYMISAADDVYVIQGNYLLMVSGNATTQIAYIDESTNILSISPDGEYILAEKKSDENLEVKLYTIK